MRDGVRVNYGVCVYGNEVNVSHGATVWQCCVVFGATMELSGTEEGDVTGCDRHTVTVGSGLFTGFDVRTRLLTVGRNAVMLMLFALSLTHSHTAVNTNYSAKCASIHMKIVDNICTIFSEIKVFFCCCPHNQ